MDDRKDIVWNVWFAYVAFYVCFKHFFINDNFLYIILDFLFAVVFIKGIYANVKIKGDICWCLYIILVIDMMISAFYADSFTDAVKFTVVYLNIIVIAFWFTQMSGWQFIYYKWLKTGCIFHLCFTFFSVVFTEQALNITKIFLTDEAQQSTILWSQLHLYAGIAGQTGANAFFFSILIGLFLSELCARRKHRLLNGMLFSFSRASLAKPAAIAKK